jgi:uncharacterized membrane protein YfcA
MSILIGIFIGLVLDLTGAGGSIFAVPLLILLLDLPVNEAIGIALGAVAVSALKGTISNWQARTILWIPALALGLGGTLMAPFGKYLGSQLAPMVLLIGVCSLAFGIAGVMWRQALRAPEKTRVVRSGQFNGDDYIEPICRFTQLAQFDLGSKCLGALIFCGLMVGLLSGLFGVGGGFLIVPALLYITQVSMRQAVATSLLIISVVGTSGFVSFAIASPHLDWGLLLKVCTGGVIGMIAGRLVAHNVAGVLLQKIFSIALVLISAMTLLVQLSLS